VVRVTKLGGRYELEERLASGGMGSVYSATDARLGRRVAVKLLREELADDPRFVERFRREARAVAALSHNNLANVFDYGEDADHHYIVMELLPGQDLARALSDEAPLDPARAADIAAQTCDALAHAHAAGVVHRDVKPGNIIVDHNGRVKVTDFGIARAAGQSTLTAAGSVIGTAPYLSPEQAAGGDIGPQSDLYSLGIVLYEMLTGCVPFRGDAPVAIAMRHISEEVPAPSAANPDVPRALDAVVAKATAKAPEQGFPSAQAMAEALRGATSAAPVATVLGRGHNGEEETEVLGPGWDRRKVTRAAALLFGSLVVVLLGALFLRLTSGNDPTSIRRAGGGTQRAGGTRDNHDNKDPSADAASFVIPEDIVGQPFHDAESFLKDRGFEVEHNEIPSGQPKDMVLGTIPPPGNHVEPGSVITLAVSSGEPAAEGEGDDESSGPGNSEDSSGAAPKGAKPSKEEKKGDD
jgi:eukaryotic-like serine/threonine-protein kinase